MFTLTRTSQTPNSPMQVSVRDAEGWIQGFTFDPAGGEFCSHGVSEHVARTVMGDAGLAPHFDCAPPLDAAEPVTAEAPSGTAADAPEGDEPARGRGKKR